MKICGISDIHGNLLENVPKCDVLCIAGDIINLNDQRNNETSDKWWRTRFIEWANKIDCGKIFVVPGNHDFYLEYLYKDRLKYQTFINHIYTLTFGKVEILIDTLSEYKGITFYGCPWIKPISFQYNKWAFENFNHNSDNIYSKIPECDVLITHDSPIENELLNIESWYKCKYHFYGHWHEGESKPSEGKYNCSRLNNYYSFKKNFEFPTININTTMEKTKYELLQKYTEMLKNNLVISNEADKQRVINQIDETFIKFLDNPQDKEDEIIWTESSVITDMDENNEESIEDEYK